MAGGDQVQRRNDQMVSLLGADFQLRYEPNFAWKSACAQYQALCALRGFWPMSAQIHTSQTDYVTDVACNFHLTNVSVSKHGYDRLIPYVVFDGTSDYLCYVDDAQFDVIGNEANVVVPGLTVVGWFYPESGEEDQQALIAKWGGDGNKSYMLDIRTTAGFPVRFHISDDGTNFDSVSLDGYIQDDWNFFAGRFNDADAGTELKVWINESNTTAATARNTIHNGGAHFTIGAAYDGTLYYPLNGRASLCAVCASALSDVQVWSLYQQTRAMFGI
jgi:hypothetical protein